METEMRLKVVKATLILASRGFTVLIAERRTRARFALLGCLILAASVACPQQAVPANPTEGKDLVRHLSPPSSPDPAGDRAVFHQYGLDRVEKLLLTVVSNGQNPAATADDWAGMHRALEALIEFDVDQQQLFKASIYANLQDSAYRNDEGDYVAALAAARQALDLQQHAGVTATLTIPWKNVGEDLIHLGHLDEGALALYQARQLIKDPTAPFAADLWSEIISLESSRGNSAAAHTESEAFLHAADDSTPAAFRADALLAAANVAIDDHRYDDAASRIHEALHAIKDVPSATLIAYQAIDSLLALGMDAMQTIPYDQAITLCDHLDKDFPGLPISISGFAHQVANHRRRLAGQFDLVLREDSAHLDLARAANDLSGQLTALLSTAVDFAYLRESTQQIAALEEASTLLHAPAADSISPLLRFLILNSLGAAELARGDLRPARATYTEVLAGIEAVSAAQTRTQLGRNYAEAQLGMAAVIERDGNLQGARDLLKKSLDPPPGSLGRFTRSTVLLQLARLEQSAQTAQAANQQPMEVTRLYLEAIAALHQEKDLDTEVYARLQLVQYLATNLRPDSSHDSITPGAPSESSAAIAREQLALSRSAAMSIGLADSNWRTLFLQGILDQNTGDRTAAIASYSAAVDALDRIRSGLSEKEERQSFIDSASVQELYRRQIELLTNTGDRDRAWEFVERDKARSFLETLHGRRFAVSPSSSERPAALRSAAALEALEQQIVSALVSLSPEDESTLRDTGRPPDIVRARLLTLESKFALARQQQTLVDTRATQPLALHPISLAITQAQLPAGTALIEYAILDHELAAFVVTHTSAKELHWLADTAALPVQLGKLSSLLSSSHASEDLIDAQLTSASAILLGPVIGTLSPQIDSLIIVPTQSLSLVPFQALPVPDSGSHVRGIAIDEPTLASIDPSARTLVIDRYAVTYLPSASTLQFLHFGPPSASPDLFLGAIGDLSVEGLPALPGTLDETAVIQKLYPRATRVTGLAFTHDAAVKALLDHQEVHFATHGLFEAQAPLFSALITAPATGQPSRLSLYEVTDLNLKARLVILSACETDRGQLTGGDEIAGLTRTFLQAGAESVVSSLWSVSDESTALLMESLHAHLRAGESTPLALRHAELQVRRKFPQPYFWAAFVDTGVR
jgi:CHAT domain-containing protein/tetratricopeptide (TPR) repeat protein